MICPEWYHESTTQPLRLQSLYSLQLALTPTWQLRKRKSGLSTTGHLLLLPASTLPTHRSQRLTFTHHCGRNTPLLHPPATRPSPGCARPRSHSPQRSVNTGPIRPRQPGSRPRVAWDSQLTPPSEALRPRPNNSYSAPSPRLYPGSGPTNLQGRPGLQRCADSSAEERSRIFPSARHHAAADHVRPRRLNPSAAAPRQNEAKAEPENTDLPFR